MTERTEVTFTSQPPDPPGPGPCLVTAHPRVAAASPALVTGETRLLTTHLGLALSGERT
ncbi:hypothetical protein MF672_013460 [Actinomadura sp. ATCC 31491]|uniref:Uncharacterized protein n=1 Tax=Actinomadura luzonensis TaxID=2805427 RepID=A0ABT0FR47_9ACTN|nr:hypothetical protein [Actinomadura luzonensis]MCK2214792.1 hypothetical protein [Actinomadura luzonensis]